MNQPRLAIEGGKPVRSKPLPLEFPGVHHMDSKEVQAAVRLRPDDAVAIFPAIAGGHGRMRSRERWTG